MQKTEKWVKSLHEIIFKKYSNNTDKIANLFPRPTPIKGTVSQDDDLRGLFRAYIWTATGFLNF